MVIEYPPYGGVRGTLFSVVRAAYRQSAPRRGARATIGLLHHMGEFVRQ